VIRGGKDVTNAKTINNSLTRKVSTDKLSKYNHSSSKLLGEEVDLQASSGRPSYVIAIVYDYSIICTIYWALHLYK
jgi:hypothetical protein